MFIYKHIRNQFKVEFDFFFHILLKVSFWSNLNWIKSIRYTCSNSMRLRRFSAIIYVVYSMNNIYWLRISLIAQRQCLWSSWIYLWVGQYVMEFLCRLSPLQDFPLNEKQYDCIYMEYLRFYSIFQYFCHNQLVLENTVYIFLCLLIYLLF